MMDAYQEAVYQRAMAVDKSDPNRFTKAREMVEEYHREREARERADHIRACSLYGWSPLDWWLYIAAALGGAGLIGLLIYAFTAMPGTAQ